MLLLGLPLPCGEVFAVTGSSLLGVLCSVEGDLCCYWVFPARCSLFCGRRSVLLLGLPLPCGEVFAVIGSSC